MEQESPVESVWIYRKSCRMAGILLANVPVWWNAIPHVGPTKRKLRQNYKFYAICGVLVAYQIGNYRGM